MTQVTELIPSGRLTNDSSDVEGTKLDVEATFCYLAVTAPSPPDAVWHRESSGNYCLSSPSGTSHLRCVAKCTRPVSSRLCPMVAKRWDRTPWTCSGFAPTTAPWTKIAKCFESIVRVPVVIPFNFQRLVWSRCRWIPCGIQFVFGIFMWSRVPLCR